MNNTKAIPPGVVERTDESGRRFWYPILKRAFDIFFASLGLAVLGPVGLVFMVLIKLDSRGSVFYRQRRIGLGGKSFYIFKFRTMVADADRLGPQVTKEGDSRITRVGRILRRTKLDELPQLWNVLAGHMSFVGPRPEVPKYVDRYTPEQRQLLQYKPGITDLATLVFRDEEALLRSAKDVETFYLEHCIPRKFRLNVRYAARANVFEDLLIILETLCPYWVGVAATYIFTLAFSYWMAYQLRFDFHVPANEWVSGRRYGMIVVCAQLLLLARRRQFHGLLTYFDLPELKQLASALAVGAIAQMLIWFITDGSVMPGRSIILIDAVLAFGLLAGLRALLRGLREAYSKNVTGPEVAPGGLRVGIVGAGELGAWLAYQMNVRKRGKRHVLAFFDDDPDKWNKMLRGVPIVGMPECLLNGSWNSELDEVIVAIPGSSRERQLQIEELLNSARIRSRRLSGLDQILSMD